MENNWQSENLTTDDDKLVFGHDLRVFTAE